eukprot:tig00020603_g11760.t1
MNAEAFRMVAKAVGECGVARAESAVASLLRAVRRPNPSPSMAFVETMKSQVEEVADVLAPGPLDLALYTPEERDAARAALVKAVGEASRDGTSK